MKNEKKDNLIQILLRATLPISSPSLAKMLGVSERTVRNYINQINQGGDFCITASKNGYTIARAAEEKPEPAAPASSYMEKRTYCLLSKLLASDGPVSVFDVAEELVVSESTVMNTVVPAAKKTIASFRLKIESKNYNLFLVGDERDKRKLIGSIVSEHTYGYFTSMETLEQMFPGLDIKRIWKQLYDIFHDSNLFFNNYALNNVLVHIMVLMIRLGSEDALNSYPSLQHIQELLSQFEEKKQIVRLADTISDLFARVFGRTVPQGDYEQILVFIALSLDHRVHQIIIELVEEEFLQNILNLMETMSQRYNLPSFDREFLMQFSLHMYQAYHRCQFHMSYPNPIMGQIKTEYALIYDMAVWLAHAFSYIYRVELNEDEIGFIAFHIGGFLENSKKISSNITCIILGENYHSFMRKTADDIKARFASDIFILDIMSVDQYSILQPSCDLLIATLPTSITHPHKVTVNPIITKQNYLAIWDEIENIQKQRNLNNTREFLQRLLWNELYFRNVSLDTPEDYIRYLGEACLKRHYIHPDFINDVLLRESVSSTAFTDYLAVPHPMRQYAQRSFICILHNDVPIPWGNKHVHFVLMIGISEKDMRLFPDAFELIVDRFCSTEKVLEILNTETFDQFRRILLQ